MSYSYQSEIPKARVNIQLRLHTGNAQKKIELPLKLVVVGDYSNGAEQRPVSEREKININKNNFDCVLADFYPSINLSVANTLAGDGSEENVSLSLNEMKDFEPEPVARQIPQLNAVLAMRNLLRDLKANPSKEKHNHLERIELRYEKITWTYKDGNIIHSYTWSERSTALLPHELFSVIA
ncbi:type VI secretion system contractile sheath small subunit [Candidatus Pantoea floridensis]|uniref:Type VI secretion system protein ImpB n=1 Tax=Candidatus Pantoea floridensis TaxID=1938870 RepID=A0A286BTC9_9GAMM|nr:type VI secretion system contractile sheath small subunit [Pantoea floridensis]PIF23927.1 type VI secretion system protein ImpB [Enterobacteriaceae bacterium JKS000233]SOD37380.1 type VI secretion system protein ImpB [Pantoea floridensis]